MKIKEEKEAQWGYAYRFWRWHLFDHLMKYGLNSATALGNDVIGAVESKAVVEDESNVADELIGRVVSPVLWIRVRFDWVRRGEFELDS